MIQEALAIAEGPRDDLSGDELTASCRVLNNRCQKRLDMGKRLRRPLKKSEMMQFDRQCIVVYMSDLYKPNHAFLYLA